MRLGADLLCPHYCRFCGVLGRVLCERCRKYMVLNVESLCLECGEVARGGVCRYCRLPFWAGWMVGYRDEPVGVLAEEYKFESVRVLGRELAELLDTRLPCLGNVSVVPVPTSREHVRARGVDHSRVIARELARLRGWKCEDKLVMRRHESAQTGVARRERILQAAEGFEVRGECENKNYLVVDDIWTTGATLKNICIVLRNAGAKRVDVAVLARSR